MSTSRLTLVGSGCTTEFLRGVCCFHKASTTRISASVPGPQLVSMRATFFQPGALSWIAFPRRDTSQPISVSSFQQCVKVSGLFAPTHGQSSPAACPDGRLGLISQPLCYSFSVKFRFSTMDSPFSMQMVSLNRRTALVLPQKLRNFRSQSALTADQMM